MSRYGTLRSIRTKARQVTLSVTVTFVTDTDTDIINEWSLQIFSNVIIHFNIYYYYFTCVNRNNSGFVFITDSSIIREKMSTFRPAGFSDDDSDSDDYGFYEKPVSCYCKDLFKKNTQINSCPVPCTPGRHHKNY